MFAVLALVALPAAAQSPEMQGVLNEIVGQLKADQGERLNERDCTYTAADIAKQALVREGFTNITTGPVVIGALENACKGVLDLLGFGTVTSTYGVAKCVYDYYTSAQDVRGLLTCLGVEVAGIGAGKLVDYLEVDPVTGALTGRVIDRIGDDLKDGGLSDLAADAKAGKVREFAARLKEALEQARREARVREQTEEPPGVAYDPLVYGCKVELSMRFQKARPPTRGDSYVVVLVSIRDCDCDERPPVGRALRNGSVYIKVPVRFTPGARGAPAWTPDLARMRTVIRSKCCNGPETRTVTGPAQTPPVTTPPAPATTPAPPPPAPKPPPPAPPPTFAERCPECVPVRDAVEDDRWAVERAQGQVERAQAALKAVRDAQSDARDEIERAQALIEGYRNRFPPSSASSGNVSRATHLTPDGRIEITTTRADGSVETTTRATGNRDVDAAHGRIEAARAKLAKLRGEEQAARAERDRAEARKAEAEAKLRADQARLAECERQCRRRRLGLAPDTGVTVGHVENRSGNNPFDPSNPVGGTATGPQPGSCADPRPADDTRTLPCPPGQSGAITQSRGYACVAGEWVPNPFETTANTCTGGGPAACTPPQPAAETRTLPCPAGQTGSIVQSRAFSCVNGDWTPGAFETVSNTCATPPPPVGCASAFSSGNYACSGSCGVSSVGLTVTPGSGSMTASPFGSNASAGFSCSGPSATSQSSNLTILGQPGHTCTLTSGGASALGVACSNTSGGSCTSSCSR